MSAPDVSEKALTLKFHGVVIPAEDYGKVKRLATLLYGEVDVRVNDGTAWRSATWHAVNVLKQWRESCPRPEGQP